jgi:hypothetical protein
MQINLNNRMKNNMYIIQLNIIIFKPKIFPENIITKNHLKNLRMVLLFLNHIKDLIKLDLSLYANFMKV